MHLFLINTLPSWAFIGLIMFSLTFIGTILFVGVRRYYPRLVTEDISPAFGVMGTSYGFLLGFVIAILWQNYTAADNVTAAEASDMNLIINNLQLLPPEDQLKLVVPLKEYADLIKNKEWPLMDWGETAPGAWKAIHNIYEGMREIHPVTALDTIAYTDIYARLGDIAKNRSARVQFIQTILPVGIRALLILGAIFIIFSLAVHDPKKRLNHFVTVIMVCFLLSFNLGLAFLLAFPFSSDVGIEGRVLTSVVPNRLAALEKTLRAPKPEPVDKKQ